MYFTSSVLENKVDLAKLETDEFCDGATYYKMEEVLFFFCSSTSAVLVFMSKAHRIVALTFYFRIKCSSLMKAIAVPTCTCFSNPLVSCFLFCHSMILALIND